MSEPLLNEQEKIQAYLSGKLSVDDQASFEQQVASNDALRNEVQFYRDLKQTITNEPLFDLKEKLRSINDSIDIQPDLDTTDIDQAVGGGDRSRWRLYGFGLILGFAILIIGSFLSGYFENNTDRTQLKQLTNTLLVPFETVIAFDPSGTSAVSLGMNAYEQADYKTAIGHLSRASTDNPEVSFYLGLSQILNKDFKAGIFTLEQLKNQNTAFDNTIVYYLALAYLQQNNINKAKILLEEISDDLTFGKDAKNLLEQI